ncbi:hypothetical protein PENTCL1PPCAC_8404, partial [Pristionchus entomophagus]
NNTSVEYLPQPPVSGAPGTIMVAPPGSTIQPEQTSQYANMQGPPRVNPNMQWQGQMQQPHMMQHRGSYAPQMAAGAVPQQRFPYQNQQQQMGNYYPVSQTGYYPAPNMYQQNVYDASVTQQFIQQQQMMAAQQQQHLQQHQAAPNSVHAPPALQQQQPQGGPAGAGVGGGGPAMGGLQSNHQQQQPMHGGGGGVPSSVAPQSLHQGNAPMTAPTGVTPVPNFVLNAQQSQQPRPPAPPVKARKILEIVDPTTQTVVNQNAIEDSKKEEDAPKAEKEEVKGSDETDSAAVDVKKQFAAQILEETTKSDQPAPALTPAAPPVKQQNKVL